MAEDDCYCTLWSTDPHVLESQGVPRRFCGHCEYCGRPGHTRHFPGTLPTTGTWCDNHYRRVLWLHPMGHCGLRIYVAMILVAAAIIALVYL